MTPEEIAAKRQKEQRTVEEMIRIYCHGKHKQKQLCSECQELLEYSRKRSEHCPFMQTKTFCSNCKVHCYTPEKRKQIQEVMRYAGPRMLFHHPIMALQHAFYSLQSKLEERSQNKKSDGK